LNAKIETAHKASFALLKYNHYTLAVISMNDIYFKHTLKIKTSLTG